MNFNFFLFLILLFTLIGCGVKSKPTYPESMKLPSYLNKFAPELEIDKKDSDEK